MNRGEAPADVQAQVAALGPHELRVAVQAPRWQIRRAALRRLEELGEAPPELLVEALGDRAGAVRRQAALSLRALAAGAVPALEAGLARAALAGHCAALLTTCSAGRELLAGTPDAGEALLLAALREADLSVRDAIAVTKALVICPGEATGDGLADLLEHPSVMLRGAAGRALWARSDRRALPWVLERIESSWSLDAAWITWLGEQGDPRALPCLKRLASPWRRLLVATGEHRRLAREAVSKIEEGLRHIPDGAISQVAPPGASAAAISLWREGELPGEAEAR